MRVKFLSMVMFLVAVNEGLVTLHYLCNAGRALYSYTSIANFHRTNLLKDLKILPKKLRYLPEAWTVRRRF